jgi:hypothetical protein
MSDKDQLITINLQVSLGPDASRERLDLDTRQLKNELRIRDYGVDDVLATAPQGTRVVDPITLGVLMLTILPAAIPPLIKLIQDWATRAEGREVEIELHSPKGRSARIKVSGNVSAEKIDELIETMRTFI